jgi:hypothetical protein
MNFLYYILYPILAYLINIIVSIFVPLIMGPFTWLLIKFQKQLNAIFQVYSWRYDTVLQGIARGVLTIYFLQFINKTYNWDISNWYLYLTALGLSYLSYYSWNRNNYIGYEFGLVFSPIIGYIIGIVVF